MISFSFAKSFVIVGSVWALILTTESVTQPQIQALRSSEEVHVHDAMSSKSGEHDAALSLVSRSDATHMAVGSGDWFDPSIWYGGEVPGDDARVLIPEGISVDYGQVSDARLFYGSR